MKYNSEQLRYAAFKQRLSGRAIAEAAGVPHATVCNILRGKHEPSARNLYQICRVLGLPMEICFTDGPETPANGNGETQAAE